MLKLFGYWRSSAAYRLRIAMNMKGLDYVQESVNIAPASSAQHTDSFKALNPQMRVPVLETPGGVLTQSMAILEWLDETYPEPSLLPSDLIERAKCRGFADTVACDIHPLNNLSVLIALKKDFGATDDQVNAWYGDWILRGFSALEVAASEHKNVFLFGDHPGLAEISLIPQIYNARRYNVDLSDFSNLLAIDQACQSLDAFRKAAPENQADAT